MSQPADGSLAGRPVQFVPNSSEIELPFYSALFASKLDHDKLDNSARQVLGLYEPRVVDPEDSCKLQVLGNALTSSHGALGTIRADGIIKNTNTLEEFKNLDKPAMIKTAGRQIWDAIKDGSIYSVPSLLSSFSIISYADLKKYQFTYWFAFPALHSAWVHSGEPLHITSDESTSLVEQVGTWRYSVDVREHGYFLVKKVPLTAQAVEEGRNLNFSWKVASLREFDNGFFEGVPEEDRYIAFVDPSSYAHNPGWQLRNLLVLVQQRFRLNKIQVLCYRDVQSRRHEARSVILPLEQAPGSNPEYGPREMPRVTGWERAGNTLRAKKANLAEYMDPARLADQSVDLNLKLMKWRIAPDLNLDIIKGTKCLLLGAGTLGSYVSRNLMGWGVRKITFVDYGKVSYSNPVRQPLFNFKDCLEGGAPKAARAAEALKEIYPGVESEGHVLSVPMLGHPFTDDGAQTKADYEKLQTLIKEHDVIFLLMDTRESRWLPTVMGKAEGKIVLTAALGFDSYVVMRHGAENSEGVALGCYFCNDVVSPSNSMRDQTLDQQCTVTRPGVAAIASALSVELLTSLLQHPLGNRAPAPQCTPGTTPDREPANHPLGLVPHQIRGYVSTFQTLSLRGHAYPNCSACGPPILSAYREGGWEFVRRALLEKEYVTEVSGLAEVQRLAEAAALEMESQLSDDIDDGMGDMDGDGEML
ncbi:related to APG7 (component of the autophagic system) [Cephalotrichum gorgonifer]|uniref:Ubiquitin-like modifier-activating enzyme ATG7 n=1 Tax=Cephalotrichum gorgonifer TaxID=2041049 RepID=A0AAE8N7K1_9PEZI|nr:related to APG7 (component of the autophagic system) [Cephalotrichum gorgonifer]